ncbi:1-aminocyclopropane-1-carboxylate deaminase [Streptomyces sp. PRh5]|uniref:1-aminocyclopropane-1-carboxylate deaminase/D-cysteine desulfhydrase n=1 Tax=Streptomyces sp. PRh5 TaxID=1158056 RepID=UPI00044E27F4|nr:pyridoxal-phosphate dependent enzyme [Streptomyces sp. PRh5]EXU69173.1 1-aminocyclopropane-1-carboxylate deaminase [Streptomyces sp. PRh5]
MRRPIDLATLYQSWPPSPLQDVQDECLARRGVELRLKRDDLIHQWLSSAAGAHAPVDLYPPGNKWRKLTPNLRAAVERGHTRLLTFGGAYSNHIRAVAAAGAAYGLSTVGVIRGDELAGAPRNWSLARAEAHGMELAFVTRSAYRETLRGLGEDDPDTLRALEERWGRAYVLPEGGTNVLAARGAAELVAELPDLPGMPALGPGDVVCCAVGTGGTLAGIAAALPPGARAVGFAVLKGAEGYLEREVAALHERGWERAFANWRIEHGYHGGGYGRVPAELEAFAAEFEARHGVRLERRYVAKLLWGVYGLVERGELARGSRVTAVITGPPDPEPGRAAGVSRGCGGA